ncbi:macro domain-containing protein [Candidatus Woesebacteria bacterium]|nr:macro domain-containing protein [Candidatus Woesebacteria bacterium]
MKTVLAGDVTKSVSVDAIITLVNSEGAWWGGVDGAIYRVAGPMYHNQLRAIMLSSGLDNGQVVVARGDSSKHLGNFDHVVFVVDDLYSPLAELLHAGLRVAREEGFKTIAIPLMRTGVMLGVVEKNLEAVLLQMRIAFERFTQDGDNDIDVAIVVYNDPKAVELLSNSLMLLA